MSFILLVSCIFKGSLQVTRAKDPARFCTIRSAALRILVQLKSKAKSLSTSSLVVIREIVTERSTTGGRISTMD